MKNRIIYIVVTIILVTFSFTGGYKSGVKHQKFITYNDTIALMDTLKVRDIVPVNKVFTRYKKLTDTVRINDTVYFPMMHTEYSGSNYHAYITGYHATLDSINLFTNNNVIINKVRQKKLGLGISIGYGITKHGLNPFIGIGFYYRLF